MESVTELPVSLPGLAAVRVTVESLHAGMKDRYGIGRIERGRFEWWGSGRVWRSAPGCMLVKQPGDVHRDLARAEPTTFTSVILPSQEVARARETGQVLTAAQFEPGDLRAAPFHRLLDAVISQAEPFALEVAVTEAANAFAVLSAPPTYSKPVRRAMEYLKARLAEPVTLADLAQHARLDKYHLCRAFRAQIGMPPHKYLTRLRIARAKELLIEGDRAADVGPRVGLYDQAQLTRHFRRVVGTTPARYSKLMCHPRYSYELRLA